MPANVSTKHLADGDPVIVAIVSVPRVRTGETPGFPSNTIPATIDPELWIASRTTPLPLLYWPNVELPRIVKVAPVMVNAPFVTFRTVEFDPSPIVVFAVTVTLLSIKAMSPAPGGVKPPQVAGLDQLPDWVEVTVQETATTDVAAELMLASRIQSLPP